ncbi:MAG TPA: hypothetical protein VH591_09500 [Ktedonobacterales bacterium]|jgi:hypothetical protein
MANTPDKSQMSDDERADLRAMIAAGRDLSPEMDESLVESYAERRASEQRAKAKVQGTGNAVAPQQQSGGAVAGTHPAVAITGIIATVAIFVAIMVFTGGHGWWLVFPLFGIFGGWWGNNDRNRARNERRAQRYQMRANYYRTRMGYPPEQDARRLPESSEATTSDSGPLPPPTSAPTQAPPSARSIPPASTSGEQPPTNPAG